MTVKALLLIHISVEAEKKINQYQTASREMFLKVYSSSLLGDVSQTLSTWPKETSPSVTKTNSRGFSISFRESLSLLIIHRKNKHASLGFIPDNLIPPITAVNEILS